MIGAGGGDLKGEGEEGGDDDAADDDDDAAVDDDDEALLWGVVLTLLPCRLLGPHCMAVVWHGASGRHGRTSLSWLNMPDAEELAVHLDLKQLSKGGEKYRSSKTWIPVFPAPHW